MAWGVGTSALTFYVGEYVKELRLAVSRTRQEVADAAGVTVTSVSGYESGKQRIPIDVFMRIVLFLEQDPAKVVADILLDNKIHPYTK